MQQLSDREAKVCIRESLSHMPLVLAWLEEIKRGPDEVGISTSVTTCCMTRSGRPSWPMGGVIGSSVRG